MDAKKRRRVEDWLERGGTFVAVAAIVAAFGWYQANRPAANAGVCREEYRAARSARDTAFVDEQMVGMRPGFTCRELRQSGSARPAQHIVANHAWRR